MSISDRLLDYDYNMACSSSHSSSSVSPTPLLFSDKSSYLLSHFTSSDKFSHPHKHFLASITTVSEASRFSKIVADPIWHVAMKLEIDALEKNKTCDIVHFSQGK